jgi:predicted ArsR family transcriptional regulator
MHEQSGHDKTGTRQQILKLLKQQGALDSTQLAAQLGASALAVHQHLYELQAQGNVTYQEQAGGATGQTVAVDQRCRQFFPGGLCRTNSQPVARDGRGFW